MSIATIGAVAATDTELLIPSIPQIPYALLLTGAGGTTEVIEVRSLQRGGHVYVTRGAFGSLPVAHTAPVAVTLYDPNSGGGGGVPVTGSQGGNVASPTGIQLQGLVTNVAGLAVQGLVSQVVHSIVHYNDAGLATGVDVANVPADGFLLDAWIEVTTLFSHGGTQDFLWSFGPFATTDQTISGTGIGGNASTDGGTYFATDRNNLPSLIGAAANDGQRYVPVRARQSTVLQIVIAQGSPEIPLTADIDNSQTTFSVSVRPGILPVAPFTILIEAEKIRVTARDPDGNTFPTSLTVTRGYQSTTPAAHSGFSATMVTPNPWAPDQGRLDVYAIIATPAS